MNYLDLLPLELQEEIYKIVEQLHQKDSRENFKAVTEELNFLWLYALWAAGFNNNNLIENIYNKNFKFNMDNDKFKKLIVITKEIDYITFIKPSFLRLIKYKHQTTQKIY